MRNDKWIDLPRWFFARRLESIHFSFLISHFSFSHFLKMSKSFTENFVHGDEAILSGKWPFSGLGEALPNEKSGRKRRSFAHRPHFCARFSLTFCYFLRFCKHAKFSKVNAKFSKVVDFFFSTKPLFCQNQVNQLTINHLVNPQKTDVFSSKRCFRGKISKYGGLKWPFCQFCSKKRSSVRLPEAFPLHRKEHGSAKIGNCHIAPDFLIYIKDCGLCAHINSFSHRPNGKKCVTLHPFSGYKTFSRDEMQGKEA